MTTDFQLVTKQKTVKKYNAAFFAIFTLFFFVQIAFFNSCTPKQQLYAPLKTADSLLRTETDSALAILNGIKEPEKLSEMDYAWWCLLSEQAKYILMLPVSPDSVILTAINYFTKVNDKHTLARCYYVQGSEYSETDRLVQGMTALKNAEKLLSECTPTDSQLTAYNYYRMGYASECEALTQSAVEYYKKALKYFPSNTPDLNYTYTNREIFRMYDNKNIDSAQYYFEQAKYYAKRTNSKKNYYAIIAEVSYNSPLWDARTAITCNSYLCDTQYLYRYAAEVAYAYMQLDKMDSCKMYLDKLANDTAIMGWSKYHYHYFSALYYDKLGQYKQAYEEVKYTLEISSIFNELRNSAQTMSTADKFDNEQYEIKNQLLQTEAKQKNLIIVIMVLLLVTVVTLAATAIAYMRQKNARQKEQIAMQRQKLTSQLQFRIACTQQLNVEQSTGSLQLENLPENIRNIVQEITYVGNKWEQLMSELNSCYADFFKKAKEKFPHLADMDLLLACLTALGLSHDDIIWLLWIPKNKYYRRRQLQKEHAGIESNKDLDAAFAEIMQSIL